VFPSYFGHWQWLEQTLPEALPNEKQTPHSSSNLKAKADTKALHESSSWISPYLKIHWWFEESVSLEPLKEI
jgi:hypothetical protein